MPILLWGGQSWRPILAAAGFPAGSTASTEAAYKGGRGQDWRARIGRPTSVR